MTNVIEQGRDSKDSQARQSLFRAGAIQFDEKLLELRVNGERRALETKPMALLHALLSRAGALAGKRELIEAVWGNADHVSEASLTTAMSKLRSALGEEARELIQAVPGLGYRIVVPVEVAAARAPRLALNLRPADTVPGRPQWRLETMLGAAQLNDVWLARHAKTQELRVFKFADGPDRLETLRREAALSRVLHASLGARQDLVRIIEWNFEERPYYIESAYGGANLPDWAAARGGLASLPLPARIAMVARIARTIGAAHAAGVLHSDIKPANVLVEGDATEGGSAEAPILRLVDFGAGGLSDADRRALALTMQGLSGEAGARGTGTLRYMAPEILAGGAPSTAADIYALGILLYQCAAGDLGRALAVGWEADIADELLREDITAAAAGDPERRLASAITLAERLDTLAERSAALDAGRREQARAASLAQQVERTRMRRPWMMAAAASLAAGLALSAVFGWQAVRDRDEARRRAALSQAVNAFLTEDLLGRGNPAQSGKADETLMAAAEAAEAGIARRLAGEPLVAGTIYLSLARAFDSRTAYDAATTAYDNAIAAFGRAEDPASAVIAGLHEATMVAVSAQPGAQDKARAMIAAAAPRIATLGARAQEAQVWLIAAQAMVQLLGGDARRAQAGFAEAASRAEAMPEVFDETTRLGFRQREAFTHLHLGDRAGAEALFVPLLARRLALNGPRHPDTLQAELNLAQLRIAAGDAAAALPLLNAIAPDFPAVFGADHRVSLEFLATRAQALLQLQRYSEAVADQMSLYRLAVAKQGARSYFALGTLADASQARCRAGEPAAGLQAAQTAYQGARDAFGPRAVLTQAARVDLAFCLIVSGHSQGAAPLLDGIEPHALAEATMDPDFGAELEVMRAAILAGAGNARAGAALAQKVAPVFATAHADLYMRAWITRLRAGGG